MSDAQKRSVDSLESDGFRVVEMDYVDPELDAETANAFRDTLWGSRGVFMWRSCAGLFPSLLRVDERGDVWQVHLHRSAQSQLDPVSADEEEGE